MDVTVPESTSISQALMRSVRMTWGFRGDDMGIAEPKPLALKWMRQAVYAGERLRQLPNVSQLAGNHIPIAGRAGRGIWTDMRRSAY